MAAVWLGHWSEVLAPHAPRFSLEREVPEILLVADFNLKELCQKLIVLEGVHCCHLVLADLVDDCLYHVHSLLYFRYAFAEALAASTLDELDVSEVNTPDLFVSFQLKWQGSYQQMRATHTRRECGGRMVSPGELCSWHKTHHWTSAVGAPPFSTL